MEKPSLDRDSLIFLRAYRSEKGIRFFAEFKADKVSNPDEGLRNYAVTLTIDPASQRPHRGGIWELTENRYYSGRKDRLRILERELSSEFTKTLAWEILSESESLIQITPSMNSGRLLIRLQRSPANSERAKRQGLSLSRGLLASGRRSHPADTRSRCLRLAVVRSQVGASPSAGGAPTATLDVAQQLLGAEAVDGQGALVTTRPPALAPSSAVDEQPNDAVRQQVGDGYGGAHD